MEKGPSHSSLLKLMYLNFLRHQGKNSDIIGFIIAHTHRVSLLILLGCLGFLILIDEHLLQPLGVLTLPAVALHFLTDFNEIQRLLNLFVIVGGLLAFGTLVLF
jgi:uncharacterized membrane protein (Fun14 family)